MTEEYNRLLLGLYMLNVCFKLMFGSYNKYTVIRVDGQAVKE